MPETNPMDAVVPNDEQLELIEDLRMLASDFLVELETSLPPGRYRSLAITNFEMTLMWSMKSITHEWDGNREEA